MGWLAFFKRQAAALKKSVTALYYATQDPELGWLPKLIAVITIAYAVSPLDLIPDFIPVLGLLDDLIILPGLIWLAIRLTPEAVWERAKVKAIEEPLRLKDNWFAVLVVFLLWDVGLLLLVMVLTKKYGNHFWRPHWWIMVLIIVGCAATAEAAWCFAAIWRHNHEPVECPSSSDPLLPEDHLASSVADVEDPIASGTEDRPESKSEGC